ncbi:MAG: T9SS type A sorting domain-containing protein [Bacteroidota bacterium]
MHLYRLALLLFLCIPLAGFSQLNVNFQPIPLSYDINSANPHYALDVNYDNIDLTRQAFHLFLPDTVGSFPLVVYIHGGGFTGGSRDGVLNKPSRIADIKYFLENGIAYASFGYRLIEDDGPDDEGVIKCLNDSKRALQFIRYHAEALHIKKAEVAMTGGSAGAGTSLWIATRDDMADPDATDPVLRESTRVCAVATNGSQASYDLYQWETQVYQDFDGMGTNFTLDSMINLLGFDRASNFYGGIDSTTEILNNPELIQYRQDVNMLYHMSSDDPPFYLRNASGAQHPAQDLFHHSNHGVVMQATALAANLPEVKADIQVAGINTTDGETIPEFLKRHLDACALSTSLESPIVENQLSIYPNPASTQVTIETDQARIEHIRVYSLTGQRIAAFPNIHAYSWTHSTANLNNGMYLIEVIDGLGRRQTKKLVVRR